MGNVARRLRNLGAIPLGCALAALCPGQAAASDLKLFTPDTLEINGNIRLVAVDGEKSWLNGGFGKLRSGSDGDWQLGPQFGNANLIWQPQFTWSLGATIVGSLQGGERTQAGLSQAYLTFKPMSETKPRSFTMYSWNQIGLPHPFATSSMGQALSVESASGMFASAAAFAA